MNKWNKKFIAGAMVVSVGVLAGCSSETSPQAPSPQINELPAPVAPETVPPEVITPGVQIPEVAQPEVIAPGVVEPEVVEPEVVEPEVVEPEAVEPEAVEPEAVEPEVVEPEVIEPEVIEPEVIEPEVIEPEVVEPEVVEPEVVQPEVAIPDGLIASVTVGDAQGIYYLGTPPEQIGSIEISPLSDGEQTTSFISGGSTQIPVASTTAFTTIFLTTDGNGYFQINLPAETLNANVVATYNTIQLDGEEANIDVSVQTATGDVSANASLPISSVAVGTGDLQVSVSWDTPTDVDLILREPDGTIIYFNNLVSDSGGALDLDSNADCDLDTVNNENITYQDATPPSGEYFIALSYYSTCGVSIATNYVVTLRYKSETKTFSGVFLPEDERGREGVTPRGIAFFEVQ